MMTKTSNPGLRTCRTLVLILVLSATAGCGKMFRGKDNADPPAKLTEFTPEIKITRVWERDTGAGTGKLTLRLKPYIYNKWVYTADYKGRLTALDLKKGSVRWQVSTKKKIASGPIANHKVVVVGTSDGEVIAYSAKNGKQIWNAPATSEVLASPVISGFVVIARAIDGQIVGLDLMTGKRLWIYGKPAPILTVRGNSAPVVSFDNVFVGFDTGKIVNLLAKNGAVAWEKTIAMMSGRTELDRLVDIDSDPLIYENTLYVSAFQRQLVAIDLKSAEYRWNRKISSFKTMAADARRLYVTDANSHVWAFDRKTGTPLWKQDKLTNRSVTGPAIVGDYIVVADYKGYLHWLSKKDGHFVARVRGDSKGYLEAPVSLGSMIVVMGRGGELAMYRLGGKAAVRKKKKNKSPKKKAKKK